MLPMDLDPFLTNFAASALVSGAVTFMLKGWFTTRLENGIRHEYDLKLERARTENASELENLRSELQRQKSMLEFAHKSLSESSAPLAQRRLVAIENVWRTLQAFDKTIPAELLPLLDYSELYPGMTLAPDNTRSVISALTEMGGLLSASALERPFVGEYFWSMVFAYQTIIIRVITHATLKPEESTNSGWLREEVTRNLIARLFGEPLLGTLDGTPMARFAAFRSAGIQRLAEAARIAASGHGETEELLARANKIAKAAQEAQPNSSAVAR